METRNFNYGGLTVQLVKSPKHGWVTTMAELAKGCGVERRTLETTAKRYDLIRKGSVVEDHELAKNNSLIHGGRGPKPSLFWTVEGMTFVAMFLRTTQCEQFREEVLKAIKALEQQGFMNSQEVMAMVKAMQDQIMALTQRLQVLEAENNFLRGGISGAREALSFPKRSERVRLVQ
jgi:hypothetical protein